MRVIITGHRTEKLTGYDLPWIQSAIDTILVDLKHKNSDLLAYSGMAGGIDLHFCKSCILLGIPYIACIPFEGQENTMSHNEADIREQLLKTAKEIKSVKNSWMVEHCEMAIAVWDGNKGGTHNVLQQLVEKRINFYWVNPVGRVTWKCFLTSPQNVI